MSDPLHQALRNAGQRRIRASKDTNARDRITAQLQRQPQRLDALLHSAGRERLRAAESSRARGKQRIIAAIARPIAAPLPFPSPTEANHHRLAAMVAAALVAALATVLSLQNEGPRHDPDLVPVPPTMALPQDGRLSQLLDQDPLTDEWQNLKADARAAGDQVLTVLRIGLPPLPPERGHGG